MEVRRLPFNLNEVGRFARHQPISFIFETKNSVRRSFPTYIINKNLSYNSKLYERFLLNYAV